MKIAVIGAGITGVTTTYFLTQKGFKVDLIESRRYPAMATSYANGGQLSASNSEAWNSWSMLGHWLHCRGRGQRIHLGSLERRNRFWITRKNTSIIEMR